jgi:hypothetical protein
MQYFKSVNSLHWIWCREINYHGRNELFQHRPNLIINFKNKEHHISTVQKENRKLLELVGNTEKASKTSNISQHVGMA